MKYSVLVILAISFGLAIDIARAPKVEAVGIVETEEPNVFKSNFLKNSKPILSDHPEPRIIDTIPDPSSTMGTEGKNIIFAEDGQNIAVIYGRSSGNPENIHRVFVAYSTDLGNTWIRYGPISTSDARRVYPGLDAEQNWSDTLDLRVHFAWHQAVRHGGNYRPSPAFYSKDVSYPDGMITAALQLPNSEERDVWIPCIGVNDSFVIITATNMGTFRTTYNCYIWRSTDYGGTWDTGRVFLPGPLDWNGGPHFRFGSDGYMFFLWNRYEPGFDRYWSYFCESFDYGLTWTQPQLIWQDNPPYPNMSEVTSWRHCYDCEVVRDTPVATIKFSRGIYDYGEIWVYRPDSGGPGNWRFKGTKLVGGDSTVPQTHARYPTVGSDDDGNAYIGYQGYLVIPGDTVCDCGLFVRPANQDTWLDYGRCTFNGDSIEEYFLEFAHNAPIVRDSVIIGMIYQDESSCPEPLLLYFDYYKIRRPGIQELTSNLISKFKIEATPNPFRNQLIFSYPKSNGVSLEIFDVSGRMVYKGNLSGQSQSINWDGRNLAGSPVAAGVYFYKLCFDKGLAIGKVVKSK